jgi:hypothetical protein
MSGPDYYRRRLAELATEGVGLTDRLRACLAELVALGELDGRSARECAHPKPSGPGELVGLAAAGAQGDRCSRCGRAAVVGGGRAPRPLCGVCLGRERAHGPCTSPTSEEHKAVDHGPEGELVCPLGGLVPAGAARADVDVVDWMAKALGVEGGGHG